MKQYSKYKESGVEWIQSFPSEWELVKFKRLAKIRNGKDQKEVADEYGEYPILGTGGEFGKSLKYIYDKSSVLLGRKGTIDKPQYIDVPFWTVDTLFYTEIQQDVNPKFLYYLSLQIPFGLLQESSAVPSMTQEKINSVYLSKPSFFEQTQIARYLDHQTAIIDELITQKEKLIELLKEKRQAVINEAVTKGLNPNAKMKDSGIEWLGEIPEGWRTTKIKWHLEFCNNKRVPIEASERYDRKGEYPYYGASGIIDYVDSYLFDGKFILVGEDGANILSRSTPLAFLAIGKFWVNNHAHILNVPNGEIEYFCEQLELNDYTTVASGSAQPKLTKEALGNIKVIVPPHHEQKEITSFVRESNNKIDFAVSQILFQIEKLKEYRQSIISEAVTGKIDVREWQPDKKTA